MQIGSEWKAWEGWRMGLEFTFGELAWADARA